jgi:hypothetical protein
MLAVIILLSWRFAIKAVIKVKVSLGYYIIYDKRQFIMLGYAILASKVIIQKVH